MAEMPEENAGGGDATVQTQLEQMQKQIADAVKRAEDAERKFEMTKQERSEERDKRQAEAEKNQQYEEAKKLQDEKLAEMQAKITEAATKLAELDTLKPKAEAWETYQQARRSELLELIPEASRPRYENAPLDLLEETVSLIGIDHDKGGSHRGAPTKPAHGGSKKWSEMTNEERAAKAEILSVDDLTKLIATG